MPIWPSSLPLAPLRDGFGDTAPSNLLRSETDTGPAKVRRRGGAKPHSVSCTYVLTDEQADIFESFVVNTLSGGSLCFDWWHPVLGRYVRARLAPSDSGLFTRSYWGNSLDWQYSVSLEYWPDIPVGV